MGKLMDEFNEAKKVWSMEGMRGETLILRVGGYDASVTAWQTDEYKIYVKNLSRGVSRTVETLHFSDCTEKEATDAALDAIRADISRREWMTEGPARLAALEAEVARLTEKLTPKGTVTIASVWPVASPPNSCPECESTDVQRLPWTLTSEPPQQPWACRICNHRWNTRC